MWQEKNGEVWLLHLASGGRISVVFFVLLGTPNSSSGSRPEGMSGHRVSGVSVRVILSIVTTPYLLKASRSLQIDLSLLRGDRKKSSIASLRRSRPRWPPSLPLRRL